MLDHGRNPHFDHLVDLGKGEINRAIFSDPDICQREFKQIFARCWLSLGCVSQLPNESDFADTVAFLCGDGACNITGQILSVDGGITI